MLFTIRFIILFFYALDYKNLKFKYLTNDIVIDFDLLETSIDDIRRKCNLMVDLLKFTLNKKILNEVMVLSYN